MDRQKFLKFVKDGFERFKRKFLLKKKTMQLTGVPYIQVPALDYPTLWTFLEGKLDIKDSGFIDDLLPGIYPQYPVYPRVFDDEGEMEWDYYECDQIEMSIIKEHIQTPPKPQRKLLSRSSIDRSKKISTSSCISQNTTLFDCSVLSYRNDSRTLMRYEDVLDTLDEHPHYEYSLRVRDILRKDYAPLFAIHDLEWHDEDNS